MLKRKASDFFSNSGDLEQESSKSAANNEKHASKADLLKEMRRKQLQEAVISNAAKQSSSASFQAQSSTWMRPEVRNAGHAFQFEEKYPNFQKSSQSKSALYEAIDKGSLQSFKQKYSTKPVVVSSSTSSSYFDKQEGKHLDAIYKMTNHNYREEDEESGGDSSDEESGNITRRSRKGNKYDDDYGNKVMITSFSNARKDDESIGRPTVPSGVGQREDPEPAFMPQSKFAKHLLEKSSSKQSATVTSSGDDVSQPLYKRIKAAHRVLARHPGSGVYLPATIKAVMHSGYPSAQYDIVFDVYAKVETIGWNDVQEIITTLHFGASASGSGDARSHYLPPPPPPPPPPVEGTSLPTAVVDVSELTTPQAIMYRTVGGVPIQSIRYDSATGKAVINEAPRSSLAPVVGGVSAGVVGGAVASRVNDVVSRINSTLHAPSSGVSTCVPIAVPAAPSPWLGNSATPVPIAAPAASSGPIVNPALANRARGGWKNKKA